MKSELETYATTVLPLGSQHVDASRFTKQYTLRRLEVNTRIAANLNVKNGPRLERNPDGSLSQEMIADIDADRLLKLFGLIAQGLAHHHWGYALSKEWETQAAIYPPDQEQNLIDSLSPAFRGSTPVTGDLGRGTFIYEGHRSSNFPDFMIWVFRMYNFMNFGNDGLPGQRFDRLYVLSRPIQNAVDL